MSKIIRQSVAAPMVYVGERHVDFERQSQAEEHLRRLFPGVTVITDADSAKLIPIEEVVKMEAALDQARAAAFNEGQRQGREAGLKEGLAEAEEVLKRFDGAIRDVLKQRQEILEEAKHTILQLAVQISRKITFDAIEVDPEATMKIISGVIGTLLDRTRLKIRVHPDHLPLVEQNIDTFLKDSTTIKEIDVVADPRVRFGGCFIETPNGDVDARLESQFEVIQEALVAGKE